MIDCRRGWLYGHPATLRKFKAFQIKEELPQASCPVAVSRAQVLEESPEPLNVEPYLFWFLG
jgi:hypothetical protein